MSTQIENVVTAFNEVLLHTSNAFDSLYREKSTNLVLPNEASRYDALSRAINSFNKSLDSLVIQLNDVDVFEMKIEQEAEQRAKMKKQREIELAQQQEQLKREEEQQKQLHLQQQQQQQQQQLNQQQQQQQQQLQQQESLDDSFNGDSNNILDDINDFLSTVPDTDDMSMTGDFNDNIQQLLMENSTGDYGNAGINLNGNNNNNGNNGNNNDLGNNDGGINMADFGIDTGNDFNVNGQGNNGEFDDNIFSEIDSMLNI